MAFDNGPLSFCVYRLDEPIPDDILELFKANVALPLEQVKDEASNGWTGRHLLEREFTEETCIIEDYIQVHFRTSELKVSAPILKAKCAQAEFGIMQEENLSGISRKRKKEIKENMSDELLASTQPTIKGFPLLIDPKNQRLYIGTSAAKSADSAVALFVESTGLSPIPLTPQTIMTEELGAAASSYDPINITDSHLEADETWAGRDFLTWLWYLCEELGGEFTVPDLGVFSLMIDGPLNFISEVSGARESVIRKGVPTLSPEADSAVRDGKKLKSAKVAFAQGDETWTFSLDADYFTFKSLKLPDGTEFQYIPRFIERAESLDTFQKAFFALFSEFLTKFTGEVREQSIDDMKTWLENRESSVIYTESSEA